MLSKIIKELVCMVIIISIATIFGFWMLYEWHKWYLEPAKVTVEKGFMDEIRMPKKVRHKRYFNTNNHFIESIDGTCTIVGKVSVFPHYYTGIYTHKRHDIKIIGKKGNKYFVK